MFMSGFAWSTSLSLVPAVFSDLYLHRDDIGQPIALFVIGASVGPTLGGVVATALMDSGAELSGYFLVIVFISAACAVPMLFVPETLPPRTKVQGKGEKASLLHAPATKQRMPTNGKSITDKSTKSGPWYLFTRVWVLLATEPIMWTTGIYNGLANGVFVLTVAGSITTLTEVKGLS